MFHLSRLSVVLPRFGLRHFESSVGPAALYPGSNAQQRFSTPSAPENKGGFDGVIPVKEVTFNYSHSSGPGGQNVNKVYTKVKRHNLLSSCSDLKCAS